MDAQSLLGKRAWLLVAMQAKPRFFATAQAFANWLDMHHAESTELVVGYWKVHTGKPSLTWAQSVEQALRFGWIDGVRRSLGDDAYCIRFTPRKPGSHWSLLNVRTAERLVAEGKMAPSGLAAFHARTAARTGKAAFEQKQVRLPPALRRRFQADAKAWAWFQGAAPSYRRTCTWWIQSAKRDDTRLRRLELLMEHCARGERLPQYAWSKAKPAREAA